MSPTPAKKSPGKKATPAKKAGASKNRTASPNPTAGTAAGVKKGRPGSPALAKKTIKTLPEAKGRGVSAAAKKASASGVTTSKTAPAAKAAAKKAAPVKKAAPAKKAAAKTVAPAKKGLKAAIKRVVNKKSK